MLADREDIRRAQYFNGGRIVIMAEYPKEKTTDVPVRVPKHSFYQNVLIKESFGIVPKGFLPVY